MEVRCVGIYNMQIYGINVGRSVSNISATALVKLIAFANVMVVDNK